jgi:OmpA-OmpF porin, OOP family
MKNLVTFLFITAFSICNLSAQIADVEGCKDSPMFSRMPNMFIVECAKNYNELELPMGSNTDGETQFEKKEGMLTFIYYTYNRESGVPAPSFFQIVKNHENAIKGIGGKKVFYSAAAGMATLYVKSGNKETWVLLQDFSGSAEGDYQLRTLEIEGMVQEITANEMLNALNATGSIALYINFASGKADIAPESAGIIDQIVQMMKDNPTLKISIEGHTDNVGTESANQALSEKRAKAVMDAVIAKGIDKSRLSFKGYGQSKPISDNTTEDGKAKNRRVEIVKQ